MKNNRERGNFIQSATSNEFSFYYYNIVINYIVNDNLSEIKQICEGVGYYEDIKINVNHELTDQDKFASTSLNNALKGIKNKIQHCRYLADIAIKYNKIDIAKYFILNRGGNISPKKMNKLVDKLDKGIDNIENGIVDRQFIQVLLSKVDSAEKRNSLTQILEKLPNDEYVSISNCIRLYNEKNCGGTCMIL